MSDIKPFKGYRPPQELAAVVASRPYDVLNRAESKAESNPQSFLRIIRSEIDVAEAISPYDPIVYQTAKKNFDSFVDNGILVQDQQDCLYVYAQTMDGQQQIGLVCGTSIDDYLNDHIKKHEYTRPQKEQDRITHITTTHLHTGPVLMAYPQVAEIDALVAQVTATDPIYDFVAEDGIGHTFWVISDSVLITQLVQLFENKVPDIYIADGHHRAASSTKVGLKMREAKPDYTGEEEFNYFLSVLFPDNQLRIIDYNRVITDLGRVFKTDLLARIALNFDIEKQAGLYKPQKKREFSMYIDGEWYLLKAKPHTYATEDPVQSLDISILSDYVIAPILGIEDQRTDDRIDFVGGIRGLGELEKRVDSGEMKLAFAIYPVSVEELMAVAQSGRVMPPKSTWFEPKLRSGLVVHEF